MKNHVRKADVSESMARAIIKPFVVFGGGVFMLVMLALLCIEADMLAEYLESERVYTGSVEHPDPAHEGCLVRVTGPLCTEEAVSAGNLGTYSGVIEIQKFATIAYADGLRLGGWEVQGLYVMRSTPFCYFAGNTPGVKWVQAGEERLALLPSGSEVTLVGRQRGNALDMVDPAAKAMLGKPAAGFLSHVNDSPGADISLHSFRSVAFFALLAYFGIWLLLGLAIRRSLWWGIVAGAALLLVAVIVVVI